MTTQKKSTQFLKNPVYRNKVRKRFTSRKKRFTFLKREEESEREIYIQNGKKFFNSIWRIKKLVPSFHELVLELFICSSHSLYTDSNREKITPLKPSKNPRYRDSKDRSYVRVLKKRKRKEEDKRIRRPELGFLSVFHLFC